MKYFKKQQLKALDDTIAQWKWVVITGNDKKDYEPAFHCDSNCFLCELYRLSDYEWCTSCPIKDDIPDYKRSAACFDTPYYDYVYSECMHDRQQHAIEFLDYLIGLRADIKIK